MRLKHLSKEEIDLSDSLVDEIVDAIGLPKTKFTHIVFWNLVHGITNKMAVLGIPFDNIVKEEGLPAGSVWALSHFCQPAKVIGAENIPQKGPLLVTTNHPGAYDALVLFSQLNRKDIMWISSEIPFFRLLPNVREHILFSSRTDEYNRISTMRKAIRHLLDGGVLVYIGAGHREPDPAVYCGAKESLSGWLDVYDTFFKFIPNLKVMPVIISGMVTKRWAESSITKIRRKQMYQQRLAEFCQVIGQLLRPGKLMITPKISFGIPFTEKELRSETNQDKLLSAVINRTIKLLDEHCIEFYSKNDE